MSEQDTENPFAGVFLRLGRSFDAWLFPVFRKQYPLPNKWPASTLPVNLSEMDVFDSCLVRHEGVAELTTKFAREEKITLFWSGVLLTVGGIFAFFQVGPLVSLIGPLIWPVYVALLRFEAKRAHARAMTKAWDLLQGNS